MNRLFLISGNSGGGKTSIMRQVMGIDREIVSVTTRLPRPGEVEGVDYYFISPEKFIELRNLGKLIEYVEYDSCSYGVTKEEFNKVIGAGNAYVICEYNGMVQFAKAYSKTTSIFIYNKRTEAELAMTRRGDSEEAIAKRLKTYDIEVQRGRGHYDYLVYNCFGTGYKEKINFVLGSILKMWWE